MENVQVISFNQEVVEAGSVRLRPEESQTIQKDQLEPKIMQAFGGLIAYATLDGIVTYMGSLLTKVHYSFIEKELGWVLPAEMTNEEEQDGKEEKDKDTEEDEGGSPEEGSGEAAEGEGDGSKEPEPEGTPGSPKGDGEGRGEGGEGGDEEVEPVVPEADPEEDDDFVPGAVDGAVVHDKGKKGKGKKKKWGKK